MEFTAGKNIAMKVPAHEYAATVAFYRDCLGFKQVDSDAAGSTAFAFGDKTLWIDSVATQSQAEIWLEVCCEDTQQAADYLQTQACTRVDAIEPLPKGFRGFWVSSPANIIHLITAGD